MSPIDFDSAGDAETVSVDGVSHKGGSTGRRLIKTFRAFGIFQAIYFVNQIGAIPLLITAWGRSLYGEWILLSSVPAYLTIADFGYGFAVANDIAIRDEQGDRDGAIQSLHSAWLVVCLLCVAFGGAFVGILIWAPFWTYFHISLITPQDCRIVGALLMVQVLLAQIQGVVRAPLRCQGMFVHGVRIKNFEAVGNLVLMVAVALFRLPPIYLAGSIAVVSLAVNIGFAIELRRRTPWAKLGFSRATTYHAKNIAWPAFTQNLIPLSTALSIQGSLAVIGIASGANGPVRALQFSTTRTLTRVITQFSNSLQTSFMPEMSVAGAQRNFLLARKLHHRAAQLSFWTAVSISAVLRLAGPFLYAKWTRGKLAMDLPTLDLLLLALIFTGCYFGSMAVPLAMNQHSRASLAMFWISLLAVPASYSACRGYGIPGVAAIVALVELIMIFFVVPSACRLIGDQPVNLFRAMLSPNFSWLLRRGVRDR